MRTDLTPQEIIELTVKLNQLTGYYGLTTVVNVLSEVTRTSGSLMRDKDYKAVCERDAKILQQAHEELSKPLNQ